MKNRYVLVTGDGEGLGNALARALLESDAATRVIGLSRRNVEDVQGLDALPAQQRSRFTHLRVDLAREAERARICDELIALLSNNDGELCALALVNGTGFLDSELEKEPELATTMEELNVRAPLDLVARLEPVTSRSAPLFYYSGLLVHPTAFVPCVAKHAAVKRRAAVALRDRWGDRIKLVMPGAFRTRMLLDNIVRESAMLEWYAVPMSDPYKKGGLADLVAGYALQPSARVPETIIRPRLTGLLVTKNSPEQHMASLPGAIRRAARGVLQESGQSDAQHDARVRFLRDRELYGKDFPYDSVLSDKLWPLWLSRLYATMLRAAGMVQ